MKEEQLKDLNKIRSMTEEVHQFKYEYWTSLSNFGAWQFWLDILLLIVPLIVLFMLIDKNKMLLLGFFGLNYHVWLSYATSIAVSLGLWEYPYQIAPFLPGFSFSASLIPVCFMLLYQWTLIHKKNIYLYAVILSAIIAFALEPIMVKLHLLHLFKGVNYVHLFLLLVALFIVSKLITNLFLWLQEKETK
ncbi:CBO0543 family protein [Alkalibacillus almallahensis]|uniref:CBO0543 family protein n=1 Tax=Alkalibacillus almallahensis TaxID=1379154 RepID=UPI001423437F|nr:hypothetical protein [Alkalibacillus almallahensis]